MARGLQETTVLTRNGGKGGMSSKSGDGGDDDDDWATDDRVDDTVIENAEEVDPPKGKEKGGDDDEDEIDDDDENDDENVDDTIISGAEETLTPTTSVPSGSPTLGATEAMTLAPTESPPTIAPSVSVSTNPPTITLSTLSPTMGESTLSPTEQMTTAPPSTLVPTNTPTTSDSSIADDQTRSPTESNLSPTVTGSENTGTDTGPTDDGSDAGGIFDGEEYYHRHLVPFAVSIEGDEVSNDLGITSCLLGEMQRNMTNLFSLDMDNFTIVQYDDLDGDGYNRYDLYFIGFGELLGLPEYSQEYFESVQMRIIGDGVAFFQKCLNDRFQGSGQSFTASALEHDQAAHDDSNGLNENGVQGGDETEEEEESKVQTNLIIGLSVAAVVVALGGIVLASRLMRRGEEASEAAGARLK